MADSEKDSERGTEGGIDCETHRERERPQISRVYGRLLRDKVREKGKGHK